MSDTPPIPGDAQVVSPPPAPAPQAAPEMQNNEDAQSREEARRRELAQEIGGVEGQIETADQQRRDTSVAGPTAMLSSGYATGAVALSIAIASAVMARQVQDRDPDDENSTRLDVNDDGSVNGEDETTFKRMARGFGVASALGFGIGIIGNVMLVKRLEERRASDKQLRELQHRRRDLRRELEYGGDVSSRGLSLKLSGRF